MVECKLKKGPHNALYRCKRNWGIWMKVMILISYYVIVLIPGHWLVTSNARSRVRPYEQYWRVTECRQIAHIRPDVPPNQIPTQKRLNRDVTRRDEARRSSKNGVLPLGQNSRSSQRSFPSPGPSQVLLPFKATNAFARAQMQIFRVFR